MSIRTLAAVAALVALAPITARAGFPYYAYAPEIVYVDHAFDAFDGDSRGRYVLDGTTGDASVVCFTRQQGDYSLGAIASDWYVFEGANCTGDRALFWAYASDTLLGGPITRDPRVTDQVTCEPGGITVSGLNSDFIGAGGDYAVSETTGDSEAQCWNKADGSNTSVGRFYGYWMAVVGRDCPMPAAPSDTLSLGQARTCDPTESLNVELHLP